jgi:integrase
MSTVLTVFALPYLPPSTKVRCAPDQAQGSPHGRRGIRAGRAASAARRGVDAANPETARRPRGEGHSPELAERDSGGKTGLSDSFARIVKRAKIDPLNIQGKGKQKFNRLTLHSLQHSFNSALANAGVNQEIRVRLTGHSSTGMNDRCTHQALKPPEQAMSVLPSVNDDKGKQPGKKLPK